MTYILVGKIVAQPYTVNSVHDKLFILLLLFKFFKDFGTFLVPLFYLTP